jgi:predicted SnoaL-like aldol condensation-catalyzing enzyme
MSFPTTPDLKVVAVDFLRKAATGSAEDAFAQHVSPAFRHHHPNFAGDAASLRDAMQQNSQRFPGRLIEVQHVIQEGDLVAVHSRIRFDTTGPSIATMHLLRFQQNLIVELWDITQPEPDPVINEHGMF